MIHMPSDYDSAKAYAGGGSLSALPLGGHICMILGADVVTNKTGADMLVVNFEISEGGESDGYFKAVYDNRKTYNPNVNWPGAFRTNLLKRDGKTNPFFKGFLTAVEESNPGYNFRAAGCEERTLKGKRVGFNFGEREYQKQDGTVGISVEPFYAVSVNTVQNGIDPPPRKKLNGGTATSQMERQGFIEVQEKLPWE